MAQVQFGIDQLLETPGLFPGRLGLVTNDAARPALRPDLSSRVALQQAGFKLVCLFSPEHGLNATAADGAAVTDGHDPATGLPIVSLYGERMHPSSETLAGLDAVLFDIPDVGARFYTYIWTLSHMLEACAAAGLPLVVLDRPNPLGGDWTAVEGPELDTERFGSFIGRAAMPIRHSLTVGEFALLWNRERHLHARLQVIPCRGWTRTMLWPDTQLPFVPPSPAITSYDAVLCYPGLCLFEATNLSAGRGTNLSFQAVGAPWLSPAEVIRVFNSAGLPDAVAETAVLTFAVPPYAGTHCPAVRLCPTNPRAFRPVRAGLFLLAAVINTHRSHFRWKSYPTAANPGGEHHFERLVGQAGIRETLEESPLDLAERVRARTAAPGWRERVEGCLLYT